MATKPSPTCKLRSGKDDGYYLNPQTWGTYMHGIFDNVSIIKNIVETVGGESPSYFDPDEFKNDQYNKLAELVRNNSDMAYIYKSLE